MGTVAGVSQAAESPALLDRRQHGIVIKRSARTTRETQEARNHQGHHVAAARVRVAASASIAEPEGPTSCEIALIPHNENYGVPGPRFGRHDRIDGVQQ